MTTSETDQPPDLETLELTDAAARLGLTREALRSRIRRHLEPTAAKGADGKWYLTLPALADHLSHGHDHPDHPPEARALVAPEDGERSVPMAEAMLVVALASNARLEDEVAWLRAEVERRGVALERLTARPWWRRLLGG